MSIKNNMTASPTHKYLAVKQPAVARKSMGRSGFRGAVLLFASLSFSAFTQLACTPIGGLWKGSVDRFEGDEERPAEDEFRPEGIDTIAVEIDVPEVCSDGETSPADGFLIRIPSLFEGERAIEAGCTTSNVSSSDLFLDADEVLVDEALSVSIGGLDTGGNVQLFVSGSDESWTIRYLGVLSKE